MAARGLAGPRTLEALTGRIVQGMSYAFGEYTPAEVDALRAMGIRYSRTVSNTGHFGLPPGLYAVEADLPP